MYAFKTTAYGANFTVSVGQHGIVIIDGLDAVCGRTIDEFVSHFAQTFNRPVDEVRKELSPLIAQLKQITV
ncbi:TPA: hypothetical protein NV435_002224 [Enterobacter hormaechei subsp. xiangfangensis]|uniref:hypothetical protein n=1 Tax=Enterobacter cloacae complex TaxID=354276 RepID=UPI0018E698A2|nr:hypothetical protein [Enterobacter hormaechei]HCJ7640096.1 hypothetical protein [Enterobacter hormaechei subsp. xiangfangensis]HDS6439388.1 hypothetical protein [Enterobacter hormaechei subsp. steigerwaltii]MBI8975746.1 hypothetical protein [Enterobacter hormaechei]MBI8997095.1 hypothetical protein [Enterobacter hormaechei]MBI9025143.1 hypothetical protein [Enterobacter hormaechei]